MKMKTKQVDNYTVGFNRRRYGNTTFTWVFLKQGDEWKALGDPWPCVMPKKAEILEAIENFLNRDNENKLSESQHLDNILQVFHITD